MTADTIGAKLEAFGRTRKAPVATPEWSPPSVSDLPARARVIGIDQSLSAFGLVQVAVDDGVVSVVRAHKITTETSAVGAEASLQKAVQVYTKLSHLLYVQYKPWEGDYLIAHEAPPQGGGRLVQTESTYMAATALRIAAEEMNLNLRERMVAPQSHAKFMTGDSKADKKLRLKQMPLVLDSLNVQNREKIKNEALRDAFSVALYSICNPLKEG